MLPTVIFLVLLVPGLALIVLIVIQALLRGKAFHHCPKCGRRLERDEFCTCDRTQ